MPSTQILKNTFASGELSPLMLARSDFDRYRTGAKTLENWVVLLQGGVRTRYGTRFVAAAKYADKLCVLRPFEATGDEAYMLEVGEGYIRFYTEGAQLAVSGEPVEVTTPYAEGELRFLRTAQANDVLIMVHENHPPAQLSRLSATSWVYNPIFFDPPPLYEAGFAPAAALTPSATTGTVTIEASNNVFLRADVDRQIQAGSARVAITGYTDGATLTGDVISPFPSTDPVTQGNWRLVGSPVAACKPSAAGPSGAIITLDLLQQQDDAPNLIDDGDFSTDLGEWVDTSGPVLVSGTHGGGPNSQDLIDPTKNFFARGIQAGMIVRNDTDGSFGTVFNILSAIQIELDPGLQGGTENDFDVGEAYAIVGTGGVAVHQDKLWISGNTAGVGSARREVATAANTFYRVQFDVSEGPISARVGSVVGGQDLFAEKSFGIDNEHEIIFQATTSTSYLEFRNNQPQSGAVDTVSVRIQSIEGWRLTDVGKYVAISDGLVRITERLSGRQVKGEIVRELSTDGAVVAGGWKLVEPAWSDELGWPGVVSFFEGRLWFAGSARFPQTQWASRVNDFYNFFLGPNARDALELPIVDSAGNITLNIIRWLMPSENLLAGTTHAEYRETGPTEGAFSATELPLVRLQSTFGSDRVQPIRVGQALLFAQRQGSKLRQMFFDGDIAQSFLARDLTNLSGHFLEDFRIVELGYQPEPLSLVWALRSDGVLLAITYDLIEDVIAWHHHVTEGQIESVAVIPHPSANTYQLWLSVSRPMGAQARRFIERVDDQAVMSCVTPVQGVVPSWKGLTVDSAVTFAFGVTPSATLTGLQHLRSTRVAIVGDGAVFPSQVVPESGELTLPIPVHTAWVGVPFTCVGETLPIDVMLQAGSTTDFAKEFLKLWCRVYQTVGLSINGERMPFRTPGMPLTEGVIPQTRRWPPDGLIPPAQGWEEDATVRFVQDQPLPATLLSVSGILDIGGA